MELQMFLGSRRLNKINCRSWISYLEVGSCEAESTRSIDTQPTQYMMLHLFRSYTGLGLDSLNSPEGPHHGHMVPYGLMQRYQTVAQK